MRVTSFLIAVAASLALATAAMGVDLGPGQWTETGVVFDLEPDVGVYYPSVEYDADAGQYNMWYDNHSGGLGYAYSTDALTWTESSSSLSFDFAGYGGQVRHPWVEQTGSGYELWFWTGGLYSINDLGHATSTDGLSWTSFNYLTQVGSYEIVGADNPWRRGSYGPADVYYNPGGSDSVTTLYEQGVSEDPFVNRYVMYYDGTTGGDEALGLGVSCDGLNWYHWGLSGPNDNPVLQGTYNAGDWDYNYTSAATVMYLDGEYHTWYSGGTGRMNEGIGYARSSDGVAWTRDPDNPIFHITDGAAAGYGRESRTYTPAVVVGHDGNLHMFFTGRDTAGDYQIDHAWAYGAGEDEVPEPATWALLLATGAFGGWIKRRRRKD